MSQAVTHPNAVMPNDVPTAVSTASELTDATPLHKSTAEKVLNVHERRAERKTHSDIIVVLEGWAYEPWSDYDIARQEVLLIGGELENYSEKAYKAQNAFEVQMDVLDAKSKHEVDGTTLSSLVQQVDETEEDFIDNRGEMFIPKSAVSDIVVVR